MNINIDDVLKDPSTSFWLKDAIKTLSNRDIVDAVNDAEILASLMKDRLNSIQGGR